MTKLATTLRSTSLLFFASGLTGLVYEVVWFKRFSYLWGNSSLAMAAVVASFLCGLGLGAWLFGAFADRLTRPIAAYGWCELAIGVFALAIPFELDALSSQASPMYAALASSPALHTIARLALTFVVLGPPCACMGATLPLLVRHLTSRGEALGASTAWLYAFNTLGAAAGAWLAGFHLLPVLGLGGTNALAVALNVVVGIGALVVARRQAESAAFEGEEPIAAPVEGGEFVPRGALFAAAALTGCAALVLQMLWTRQLALLLGGTTYAFSATLFVFILGLGLGSLCFRLRWTRAAQLERVVAAMVALVVFGTLVGLWSMPQLAILVGYVQEMRFSNAFNSLLCSSVAAVLEAPATFGMGVLFPALVQLTRQDAAHSGRAVGRMYALNTLGAIAGASCAALLLLPALGSFWSFRLALGGYAIVPALLYRARSLALSVAIVCGIALLADWRPPDPMLTNLGLYMYGAAARDMAAVSARTALFREGASCNVLVLESDVPSAGATPDKVLSLRVNGKIDASSAEDMLTQLAIAYWPRFLRPRAKNVLVIGMGSGTTAGASALFPQTRVTCCEIEPAIAEAAELFANVNHRVIGAPNVDIVFDDGRSRVQGSSEPLDLILSEPSNPWIAGVANLFTEQFYTAVRARLGRDGVLCQWVQTYAFSPREYALIARTLTSVFPHCAFVRINDYDTLILGSSGALMPAAAAIDESQRLVDASAEVRGDLQRYFATTSVRELLLSRTLLDERGLARFLGAVGGSELNTDSNLRLEFEAPRRLFHPRGDPAAETMHLLMSSMDPTWQRDLFTRWNCGANEIDALRQLKDLLYKQQLIPLATALVDLGLAYEPDDAELLVDHLLFTLDMTPEEFEESVAHAIELSPREVYRLAASLGQKGEFNAARIVLEKLAAKLPTSATVWTSLAGAYRAEQRDADSQAALAKARELDPLNDALLRIDARTK